MMMAAATLQDKDNSDPPAAVLQEIQALKPEPKATVEKYVAACWNKIETIVQFEVEPEKGVALFLEKRLSASAIQELRNLPRSAAGQEKYIIMVYDCKAAGEASSHPSLRIPPLMNNGGHLKDFVKGALAANADKGELGPHDLFFIPNAGKQGHLASFILQCACLVSEIVLL